MPDAEPTTGPTTAAPSLVTPLAAASLSSALDSPDYPRLVARLRHLDGCRQPVHLRGHVEHRDPLTGRLLHRYTTTREPGGVLRVACKTRRASRCPSCAETYRADTYQLIRAGLAGGKGVPDSVTTHPAAFVTLTAPSFGTVHTRRESGGAVAPCHPRRNAAPCPHGVRLSCTVRHGADDPRLGTPLCPDGYDRTGTVLFNALAPELWRRFTLALRRRLARAAGLTLAELREQTTVSFAKVSEYQRRGLVHFHAVIRLDGPDGPASPPPAWAAFALLADAVRHAAPAVTATPPAAPGVPARSFAWGRQLDIRPITTTGHLTDTAVAGYIAKYATKAAECVGTLDRRVRPGENLAALHITDHARRLIAECLRLGALPELAGLRLAEWAHMLGFRGHFSTKSRRYSTTLGALRSARATHNQHRHDDITTGRLPLDDDQVLTVAHWAYAGRGLTPGEALLSAALTGKPLPALFSDERGSECPSSS
ncbi:replication initiator [Actinomadura parmotrematis]|uniref:Replication initiation protein n=1 Tax=Actinomadura parmotrematis TaxID=2864039 RepID=A0ABS7G3E5_9ACTN|nr:replication initiator [Actinomadura parmotrematis]MBW8487250.1 replication initiation protein [Actinomadura parmotrematis]